MAKWKYENAYKLQSLHIFFSLKSIFFFAISRHLFSTAKRQDYTDEMSKL